MRGMAVAFCLAIGSNRVFDLDFGNINQFFITNHLLYGLAMEDYNFQREIAYNSSSIWLVDDEEDDQELAKQLKNSTFTSKLENYNNINFASDRYCGLSGVLENDVFGPILHFILAGYNDDDYRYNFSLIISAAFRILFGLPTDRFEAIIHRFKYTTPGWMNPSTRIGIDISGDHLNLEHMRDFAIEFRNLIATHVRTSWQPKSARNIVVFIAHSNAKLANQLALELVNGFKRSSSDGINFHSIDDSKFAENELLVGKEKDTDWLAEAFKYLNWFVLTKCDYLLISRGGFYGETAAMMSSKPTRRYVLSKSVPVFQDYYNLHMSKVTKGSVNSEDLF